MNKSYLVSFIIIYCSVSTRELFSQFSAKQKYFGLASNIHFAISENEKTNYFSQSSSNAWQQYYNFNVTPDFGFVLNEKMALGIKLQYSYESYNGYGRRIDTEIALFPCFRIFKAISPNIIIFSDIQLNAGYGLIKDRFVSDTTVIKFGNKWSAEQLFGGVGISPGVLLFISKKISLQFDIGNIGYTHTFKKIYPSATPIQTDSFLFSYNDIGIGMKFFFILNPNLSENTDEKK